MTRHLSLAPYEAVLLRRYPTDAGEDERLTADFIAVHAGCTRQSVSDWRRRGVDLFRAEELAIKTLGVMPWMIWPEWGEEIDKEFARRAERRKAKAS